MPPHVEDLSKVFTFEIADNASLSGGVYVANFLLMKLIVPSDWVTATVVTFQAALEAEGETPSYLNVYEDDGTEYQVTVAASRHVILDPAKFAGIRWMKIRSGTSGSAVNQTADDGVQLQVIGSPL